MRSLTGVEREEYSPTLLTPINAAVSRLVPDSVRVGLGTFLLGIFCWRDRKGGGSFHGVGSPQAELLRESVCRRA